ncbi:transcriptional regulator, LuxR family [Actinobacteria bacterium OK074]|nr:transcriptional regulator, LuxR family [Actinobacteria bacterium OK074]
MVAALDDYVTRIGIATMLEQLPTVHHVIDCEITRDSLRALGGHGVKVIILSASGLERQAGNLQELVSDCGAKILVLLEEDDLDFVGHPIEVEPNGFILRSELTLDVLRDTIVRLALGELPISSAVVRGLLTRVRRQPGESSKSLSPSPLTDREQQTLILLSQGFSNKQIARRLGISANSVKRYVANILAKLNCPNRTLAVASALKNGLIQEG